MTKLILLFFFISSNLLFSQTWQKVGKFIPEKRFQKIHFINSNCGWIAGEKALLLKTTDGGARWDTLNPPTSNDLIDMHFYDSLTGGVSDNFGQLFSTTDGGKSWKTSQPRKFYSWGIPAISFTSRDNWYAATLDGIFKTTDQGNTWTELYNTNETERFTNCYFADSQNGFFVTFSCKVFKTTDGGGTWKIIQTPLQASSNFISFVNKNTGWICTNWTSYPLIKTTDGGETWVEQHIGLEYELSSIHFINENIGFVTDFFGTLYYTNNGGNSWSKNKFIGDGAKIFFLDQMTGWKIFDLGNIHKTADGGKTWTCQSNFTSNALYSVYFIDNANGWTVGENGAMMKTTDNGVNWQNVESGVNTDLKSILFINHNIGLAAGDGGVILKTTDGGKSWKKTVWVIPTSFKDLKYLGGTTVCLAGAGTIILKSEDLGDTWPITTPANNDYINCMCFYDDKNGWAVGGQQYDIWRTIDGASNWSRIFYATDKPGEYFAVASTDSMHCWAAGVYSSGWLSLTTDGGNNWRHGNNLWVGYFSGIVFLDTLHGWMSGAEGNVLYTSDGGVNWIYQKTGTKNNLQSICIRDSKHGWCVGGNGTILRLIDGTDWVNEPDLVNAKLNVFPNPATDFLNISGLSNTNNMFAEKLSLIEIYSANGSKVKLISGNFGNTDRIMIDVSDLAAGLYYLRIGSSSLKFVKIQ